MMTIVYQLRARVYIWYKQFREGREVVEDVKLSGSPLTSTDNVHVEEIKTLLLNGSSIDY